MMKHLFFLLVMTFTLSANERKYPLGFEHSDPPPGDEFLTNRFGRTWYEPIYNGYLLVDDHYVDAPYVVEQRGFVIFVNGERVEDGVDIRWVLPLPPPPAVTNDPGSPPGITKQTAGGLAVSHPVYKAKRRYSDYLGLTGEARAKAEMEQLLQLPCISNIVPIIHEGGESNRYMVYDYSGGRFGTKFNTDLTPQPPKYEDEKLYPKIMRGLSGMSDMLWNNSFTHVRNGGLVGTESAVLTTNMWRECLEIMAENITPEERFAKARAKGYFPHEDLHGLRGFYPFDGFHTSTQLWQRLSGDMSWTNDAPARMFALTNGWQKIEPAFMRTQTVVVATAVVPPPAIPPKVTPPATETNPPPRVRHMAEVQPAPETTTPMSSSMVWWVLAGFAVVGLGLALLWRRIAQERK